MIGRVLTLALLALLAPAVPASAAVDRIEFTGFLEGDVVRDQYVFRGLRVGPDDRGGPFYDDAGSFGFLLDSPPGLLNFNPLTEGSGPGRVHASVGTYVFDMVDPTNPFVASFTDHAEVVVALVDAGDTVLTAYGAGGEVLATYTLTLDSFVFGNFTLSVSAPGIQRFTLTTPLVSPTIGALVDTLQFETPVILPARPIEIDVRPGSPRNVIRPLAVGTVAVAILSADDFDPTAIDPQKVLFQGALPVSFRYQDRNQDRVGDLIVEFRLADLRGLTPSSTHAVLSAVDVDGTSLKGNDQIRIVGGSNPGGGGAGGRAGGSRLVQRPAP